MLSVRKGMADDGVHIVRCLFPKALSEYGIIGSNAKYAMTNVIVPGEVEITWKLRCLFR